MKLFNLGEEFELGLAVCQTDRNMLANVKPEEVRSWAVGMMSKQSVPGYMILEIIIDTGLVLSTWADEDKPPGVPGYAIRVRLAKIISTTTTHTNINKWDDKLFDG